MANDAHIMDIRYCFSRSQTFISGNIHNHVYSMIGIWTSCHNERAGMMYVIHVILNWLSFVTHTMN